jgi:hypothetical protein
MAKKTTTKKPATKKRPARPDASQSALASVEQIIGGKLSDGMNLPKAKGPSRRKGR